MKNTKSEKTDSKIDRKEAIKKIGLTTLSAATMMMLLNEPAKAADSYESIDLPPEWIDDLEEELNP